MYKNARFSGPDLRAPAGERNWAMRIAQIPPRRRGSRARMRSAMPIGLRGCFIRRLFEGPCAYGPCATSTAPHLQTPMWELPDTPSRPDWPQQSGRAPPPRSACHMHRQSQPWLPPSHAHFQGHLVVVCSGPTAILKRRCYIWFISMLCKTAFQALADAVFGLALCSLPPLSKLIRIVNA